MSSNPGRRLVLLLFALLLLSVAGCAKKSAVPAPDASSPQGISEAAAFLAYEHQVDITLPAEQLDARMAAVRDACLAGTHGRCNLLEFSQSSGRHASGTLSLRVVPDGVEALVGLAASGGEQTQRSTRAEDLAQAVADTARQIDQLQRQRALLVEFQQRKDLTVGDMLSIARELATIDASLAASECEAAQQTMRLQTNLLTIDFDTPYAQASRMSRLGEALSGSLDSALDGLIEGIEMLTYLLPLIVLGFVLALLWRWLWRKATRVGRHPGTG